MASSIRYLGLAVGLAWSFSATAQGDTSKCTDANGRLTYTNVKEETKGKNCIVVTREISVVPSPPPPVARTASARPSLEGFPKVDSGAQKNRDVARRKILEDELAEEQKSLEQAKAELTEQEQTRNGDERNYSKVLERLQKYKGQVVQHEKNLQALKKELGNIK